MNNNTKLFRASICAVKIGLTEIEGLLVDTGAFAVSVQQCATLFQVRPDNAQRDFKALIGKGFRFVKIKIKNAQSRKPENCLVLKDFEILIARLDRKGNKIAQNLRDDLAGLSLNQLFADAFGIKFEQEERQQYLIQRQTHRQSFHPLYTYWLKKDGFLEGKDYAIAVNHLKLALNLPLTPIDQYDVHQLLKLNISEARYDAFRLAGLTHLEAMARLG